MKYRLHSGKYVFETCQVDETRSHCHDGCTKEHAVTQIVHPHDINIGVEMAPVLLQSIPCQKEASGQHLKSCLDLSFALGWNDNILGSCNSPQASDGEFTGDDQQDSEKSLLWKNVDNKHGGKNAESEDLVNQSVHKGSK